MKPVMKPRVVVLPQPDGPTSATSSPWPTVRFKPWTAATWPYSTVRPSMSSFMDDSPTNRGGPPCSSPDRPAEPADPNETLLQQRECAQDRHERDQAAGRQERPVDPVTDLLDVPLESDGVWLRAVLGDQDQRQRERVPAV